MRFHSNLMTKRLGFFFYCDALNNLQWLICHKSQPTYFRKEVAYGLYQDNKTTESMFIISQNKLNSDIATKVSEKKCHEGEVFGGFLTNIILLNSFRNLHL